MTERTIDLSAEGLEPSPEAMRELLRLAGDRVVEHVATLDQQRACDLEGEAEVAKLVQEPMPEHGAPYEGLLDLVFDKLVHKGYNTAHGGALSYVTGGGLFHSAVADLVSSAVNRYVAYWGASPGMAQLEHAVIRWFSDLMGYPASAGGVLLSGGSIANLSALVTARRERFGDDFSKGVLYASDQVHHSVKKSAILAGFPERSLRMIPSDPDRRISIPALAEAIARDRAAGLTPFFVVASAGTTNTGAVDDLGALADLAQQEQLWLHVDAAYGGFFMLTDRGRAALQSIDRADSVVLDPHKSLFLPFGTGCLVVRDVGTLRRAHLVHSDYIHAAVELGEDAGALNFGDLSPEMSRGVRGLRVWLPMKLLGASAFRKALDEKLDLARWCADQVRALPGFTIVSEPVLSIFAFRANGPGLDGPALDALNRKVMDRVNQKGRVHLSATQLDGRFTLRICVLAVRTHRSTLEACLEDLQEALVAS